MPSIYLLYILYNPFSGWAIQLVRVNFLIAFGTFRITYLALLVEAFNSQTFFCISLQEKKVIRIDKRNWLLNLQFFTPYLVIQIRRKWHKAKNLKPNFEMLTKVRTWRYHNGQSFCGVMGPVSVYDSFDYSSRIALHCGYYLASLLILLVMGIALNSLRVAAPSPRQRKNVFPLSGGGCGYT